MPMITISTPLLSLRLTSSMQHGALSNSYLEKVPEYREAKVNNGGLDPFSPKGQPHFELDFVCMFGSAFQWHYPIPKEGKYISVVVNLVRPVSEGGEVKLNSADPLVQPNINLKFFADDLDIIAMREGIWWTNDLLLKCDGFKDVVVDQYPWDMPLDSDKDMKRAVLDRSQTAFVSFAIVNAKWNEKKMT